MRPSFYVAQSYVQTANAAVKPRVDFEDILENEGISNIGLKRHFCKGVRIEKILNAFSALYAILRMPKRKVAIFQYPAQYALKYLLKRAIQRQNKVIFIIHDLNELRGMKTHISWMLPLADVLIVHTDNMKEWVEKHYPGVECVVLGIFDYLSISPIPIHQTKNHDNSYSIVFAGNLSKAEFLYKLPYASNISYNIYGNGIVCDRLPLNVNYQGVRTPDKIIEEYSNYDFGLVWDGDSIDECNGDFGNYLRYNCPYKASSYICGGLPLIVWKKMGLAKFIEQNNIGITVESLKEIPQRLKDLSIQQYTLMQQNVIKLAQVMKVGGLESSAIKEAVSLLY